MAFLSNIFGGKGKTPPPPAGGSGDQGTGGRDERKAQKFFAHAKTLAETANYDYAIECFVNGLRHDPTNIFQHEALREVAKKRRVAGGKPAGALERMKFTGKDPVEKMTLVAERLWSMKPLDADLLVEFMTKVAAAHQPEQGLSMHDVIEWSASLILKERTFEKPATLNHYITVTDILFGMGQFTQATEACRIALGMDKNNPVLHQRLKDIGTEDALQKSRQLAAENTRAIKDADKQKENYLDAQISLTEQQAEQHILNTKKNWDAAPDDVDLMRKYVAALQKRETDKHDELAAAVLKEAFEKTTQYRFKQELGDLRIKGYDRKARELKKAFDANPTSAELKKALQDHLRAKLLFEVGEFAERVQNIPTDRAMKYEYARRLLDTGKIEEAIPLLQTAKSDPRIATKANQSLGRAFMKQTWFDLAITAFDEGLKAHTAPNDPTALELHYSLMDAKAKLAVRNNDIQPLIEAQKHASFIMQNNIGYKDTRGRLDEMVKLIEKIKAGGAGAGPGTTPGTPSPA
jgi:hypothetical protein